MGTLVGTPLFVSPEILRNEEYTSKSDLYSVGIILYYMITKKYPFGDTSFEFFSNMRNENPLKFPIGMKIDKEMKDLMKKLITHHEKDRLSWENFFEHPFVKRSLKSSGHSLN